MDYIFSAFATAKIFYCPSLKNTWKHFPFCPFHDDYSLEFDSFSTQTQQVIFTFSIKPFGRKLFHGIYAMGSVVFQAAYQDTRSLLCYRHESDFLVTLPIVSIWYCT